MSKHRTDIALSLLTGALLLGLSIVAWMKPADSISLSERRPLKPFPPVRIRSVLAGSWMSDFEAYAVDQFPMRDAFRNLKAVSSEYIFRKSENNRIYAHEGYLSKVDYPLSDDSVNHALSLIRKIYDQYLAGSSVSSYAAVIPDKNYYMAEAAGQLHIDYESLFDRLRENLEFAEYIDLSHALTLEDFYGSDTHWRQEKILEPARKIGAAMGVSLDAVYETKRFTDDFLGVHTGPYARSIPPEDLNYLEAGHFEQVRVFDHENNRDISLYNFDGLADKDPYSFFLYGPLSLITLQNPHAETDRELILFRDSFGSSIAPLFTEAYAKITVVDIRYIQTDFLDRFIQFTDQDVLFLYSTLILNQSSQMR